MAATSFADAITKLTEHGFDIGDLNKPRTLLRASSGTGAYHTYSRCVPAVRDHRRITADIAPSDIADNTLCKRCTRPRFFEHPARGFNIVRLADAVADGVAALNGNGDLEMPRHFVRFVARNLNCHRETSGDTTNEQLEQQLSDLVELLDLEARRRAESGDDVTTRLRRMLLTSTNLYVEARQAGEVYGAECGIAFERINRNQNTACTLEETLESGPELWEQALTDTIVTRLRSGCGVDGAYTLIGAVDTNTSTFMHQFGARFQATLRKPGTFRQLCAQFVTEHMFDALSSQTVQELFATVDGYVNDALNSTGDHVVVCYPSDWYNHASVDQQQHTATVYELFAHHIGDEFTAVCVPHTLYGVTSAWSPPLGPSECTVKTPLTSEQMHTLVTTFENRPDMFTSFDDYVDVASRL